VSSPPRPTEHIALSLLPADLEGERSKRGRATRYRKSHVKPFLEAVIDGAPVRVACAWAGISETTVRNWLSESSENHRPLFLEAFRKAQAACELEYLRRVKNSTDYRSAQFWLERRCPEFRKDPEQVFNIDNSNQTTLVVDEAMLTELQAGHAALLGDLDRKGGIDGQS